VEELAGAGASSVTFHIEVMDGSGPQERQQQAAQLADAIRRRGMRAGIALAPSTPVAAVEDLVLRGAIDMVTPQLACLAASFQCRVQSLQSLARKPPWRRVIDTDQTHG
jgi:hypothetical protein